MGLLSAVDKFFAYESLGSGVARGLGRVGLAVGQHYAYQAAADYLDTYSSNENANIGTRALFGVASLGLRYKSYQGPARTIARGIGLGVEGAALRRERAVAAGIPWEGGIERGSWAYGAFGPRGAVSSFLAAGDLSSLAGKGVMFAGAHVGKFPVSVAKSVGEYASVYGSAIAGNPGWLGKMASMSHPFAAPLALGLAGGAASAYMEKMADPFSYGPVSMNKFSSLPTNPQNFGQGIAMGMSAMRSPAVMDGQAAVTTKMLKRRAV